MYLPPILEDETLNSYLSRIALIYGLDCRSLCRILNISFKAFKQSAGLASVVNELIQNQISIDELIEKHTDFNSLSYLYKPTYKATLKALYRNIFERSLALRHSKPFIYHNFFAIKFCPECFKEQIKKYGMPYIRRQWLGEINARCLKHKNWLVCLPEGDLKTLFKDYINDNTEKYRQQILLTDECVADSISELYELACQNKLPPTTAEAWKSYLNHLLADEYKVIRQKSHAVIFDSNPTMFNISRNLNVYAKYEQQRYTNHWNVNAQRYFAAINSKYYYFAFYAVILGALDPKTSMLTHVERIAKLELDKQY